MNKEAFKEIYCCKVTISMKYFDVTPCVNYFL